MRSTQKTIGGREYGFLMCAATEALDLELSLAKVGGSWLANVDIQEIAAAFGGQDAAQKAAAGIMIAKAVGEVAGKLSHSELLRLMKLLFQYVTCDGVTITDLNLAFAGRPREIWQVFIEALKVNLGPLGEGLLSSSPAAKT